MEVRKRLMTSTVSLVKLFPVTNTFTTKFSYRNINNGDKQLHQLYWQEQFTLAWQNISFYSIHRSHQVVTNVFRTFWVRLEVHVERKTLWDGTCGVVSFTSHGQWLPLLIQLINNNVSHLYKSCYTRLACSFMRQLTLKVALYEGGQMFSSSPIHHCLSLLSSSYYI